ncbi:MAG: MFS transporter [Ilumatobacteraceae bacterium]
MSALTDLQDGRARLVTRPFVLVTVVALIFFVYVGMMVPIVPLFIEGPLDAGEFGIGLTVAVFALTAILARPVVGRIADRYGRRVLMVGGALIAAAGGALSAHAGSLTQLLALRGLMGIGEAAVFVGAATLIADLSPRDRRAEGASYFSVAVFGGLGVGPILGERLLGGDHFARAFTYASLFAVGGAVVALFAPSRVVSPDADQDDAELAVPDGKRPLIHPVALLPGLVLACSVAGFAAFSAFIPEYSRDVGLSESGGLFAVYALVSLVVRVVGARWPEQLGPRRAVTIGMGNILVSLSILVLVPTTGALWVAAAVMGVGVAFNYPSLMALTINRASDRDRAMAISSFTMFFEVGSAIGGLVIGAFAQMVGKQIGFLGGVAFCAIGIWLLRTKVVPAGSPDAGPIRVPVGRIDYIPVAGD